MIGAVEEVRTCPCFLFLKYHLILGREMHTTRR
jgi:hypothetical protein